MRTNGCGGRIRKLCLTRGRLHGFMGLRQPRVSHSTEPARRIPHRPLRSPSGYPHFVDSTPERDRSRLVEMAIERCHGLEIEDYAMLGDCETSALVARNGSVDWLCWPRFDSGACSRPRRTKNGARLLIAAAPFGEPVRRHFREKHAILETEIETEDGYVFLIEFMPPRHTVSTCADRGRKARHGSDAHGTDHPIHHGSLLLVAASRMGRTPSRQAGPDMVVLRTPVRAPRRRLKTGRRVHRVTARWFRSF